MPAMLDDPETATIYRVSGQAPLPDPGHPSLPETISPRQVTLRDRQTIATVVPFASRHQVPESLLRYLNVQFNKEIEGGDTYPMMDPMPFTKFALYWFQNFGAVMLLGRIASADEVVDGRDWSKECLGTFYIKPNYPGRSSHVCNAGFITTDASRNRGVGRLMGEAYLDYAPKLGYTYSVFNLVYETNVASCKIWDALGFKRIGRVKGCGNLKSYPGQFVDAIIYGRDLDGSGTGDELVSEERFDKIKYYLKYGRYPNGADRAAKTRLRSSAIHYKLLDGDVLMLKDKEVIADPRRQYLIARRVHEQTLSQLGINRVHAGINKTTALVAEKYHWSRIKETVSDVIRNCAECNRDHKNAATSADGPPPATSAKRADVDASSQSLSDTTRALPSHAAIATERAHLAAPTNAEPGGRVLMPEPPAVNLLAYSSHPSLSIMVPSQTLQTAPSPVSSVAHASMTQHPHNPMLSQNAPDTVHPPQHTHHSSPDSALPLPTSHMHVSVYQDLDDGPIDPRIISQSSPQQHSPPQRSHISADYAFSPPSHAAGHEPDPDPDSFQALLAAADLLDPALHDRDEDVRSPSLMTEAKRDSPRRADQSDTDQAAVDRDLEMLIEQHEDSEAETDRGGLGIGPSRVDGQAQGLRRTSLITATNAPSFALTPARHGEVPDAYASSRSQSRNLGQGRSSGDQQQNSSLTRDLVTRRPSGIMGKIDIHDLLSSVDGDCSESNGLLRLDGVGQKEMGQYRGARYEDFAGVEGVGMEELQGEDIGRAKRRKLAVHPGGLGSA